MRGDGSSAISPCARAASLAKRPPNMVVSSTVKALVLKAYGELEVQERPEPAVGPHDVLVRVMACGICGSDVHGLDGSTGRRRPPIVMGHEAAGLVERVGTQVTSFR